jgi:hypothetical protein
MAIPMVAWLERGQIVEEIAKIPDVIIIIKTSGDYDLQITAVIREICQLFDIQEKIARIPNITRLEQVQEKLLLRRVV